MQGTTDRRLDSLQALHVADAGDFAHGALGAVFPASKVLRTLSFPLTSSFEDDIVAPCFWVLI